MKKIVAAVAAVALAGAAIAVYSNLNAAPKATAETGVVSTDVKSEKKDCASCPDHAGNESVAL